MNKVLIGLFSNTWSPIWTSIENTNSNIYAAYSNLGSVLCKHWEKELVTDSNFEPAIFQDSLSDPIDFYPATYRRFKQIGVQTNEKIRNLFELGFEKGFDRVVFVDPILAFCQTNIFDAIQNNWKPGHILFLPDSTGKVALCGMEEYQFWQLESFDFQEKEAIVEILSECNSKEIPFNLLNPFDVQKAENLWKQACLASFN